MDRSKEKKSFVQGIKEEIRHNRASFIVRTLLILSVIGVMVRSVFLGNFEHVFLCLLTLILFALPSMVAKRLSIKFPTAMEILIMTFIYAAEVLGEISCFYMKFPFWDTLLHTTSGFLFAAIGFAFVDILNKDPNIKFQLSPFFLALFAFCFALMIGTIWEFFECSVDLLLHKDMQKDTVVNFIYSVYLDPANANTTIVKEGIEDVILVFEDGTQQALGVGGYLDVGLYDTMEDMFVNFIGATVFSFFGYFYVKTRGRGKIAKNFIPTLEENGERMQGENSAAEDAPSSPEGSEDRA